MAMPANSVSMSSSVSTRHALAADLAQGARVVGVVPHQRRHVERRGQPGLAVVEQVAEALVRLLGGAEAGELAHRPQPAAVHRRVDAARERKLAREADLLGVGQIVRGVEGLDRLAGVGGEERVALGVLAKRSLNQRSASVIALTGVLIPGRGFHMACVVAPGWRRRVQRGCAARIGSTAVPPPRSVRRRDPC